MRTPTPVDLEVATLGQCTIESPMQRYWAQAGEMEIFVSDEDKILLDDSLTTVSGALTRSERLPAFELAGPRRSIFFDPAKTSCAIVTCGGLCPGRPVTKVFLAEANVSIYADSSIPPKCFANIAGQLSVFDFSRKLFHNLGEAGPRL